jgi:hypothetical protein
VPIDDDGAVAPYPRRSVPQEKAPIDAILLVNHRPGSSWDVKEISPGEASVFLTQLVTSVRDDMGTSLQRLAKASLNAPHRFRGKRGAAQEVVEALKERELLRT